MIKKIPKEVIEVLQKLEAEGLEAFIVGGCVRDLLADRMPKDWDVATNAKPDEVQKIFPDSFYENEFGTVGVKVEPFIKNGNHNREHDVIEVTTYRIESKYSDKRRPDKVELPKL
jgi:tRNA nucleotidyltransferase (CCA-adding enzyme)